MNEALSFVRENKEGPFFIYLAVAIPHAAMQVPEAYAKPWREKFPQFNDKVGHYAGTKVTNPIANFAGMMTLLDNGIGELLELLDELEIDDNTIVMLSSDNGPHQEGGHEPGFFDSNGPFRGYKRSLTEGGIRTHMLARWPGRIAPGSVTDHVSAHWDVLPTTMDLAGADSPEAISGISFLPTLLGQESQKDHDYLYWEFYERGGKRAARWGEWKALQLEVNQSLDSPIEIYDLSKDPGEANNLAEARPDLVRRAKAIFAEAHVPSPDWKFKNDKP